MKVTQKCHIQRSLQDKKRKNYKHQLLKPIKASAGPQQRGRWACLPAGAALLHHLGAVEAGQLAESVIAVDHGPLHDLSVAYEEAGL